MKIWLDTEFNGFGGELISIGLVDREGRTFYGSLGCDTPTEWVAEHVLPFLGPQRLGIATLQFTLREYLAKYTTIEVVADWPEDIAHFCKLLCVRPGERMTLPPMTFTLCTYRALPSEIPHNALADAKALCQAAIEREAYTTGVTPPSTAEAAFWKLRALVERAENYSLGRQDLEDAKRQLSIYLETAGPSLLFMLEEQQRLIKDAQEQRESTLHYCGVVGRLFGEVREYEEKYQILSKALSQVVTHIDGNTRCLVRDLVNWGTPRTNPNDFYSECDAIEKIALTALEQGELSDSVKPAHQVKA